MRIAVTKSHKMRIARVKRIPSIPSRKISVFDDKIYEVTVTNICKLKDRVFMAAMEREEQMDKNTLLYTSIT